MNIAVNHHVLVLRFSAMGDVAMTVPVVRQLLDQYPNLSVTFVSDKKYEPLFRQISRLEFFGADFLGSHQGIIGLYKLFRQLKKRKHISSVADLHNVLRTKVLSFFFLLSGIKTNTIDKGRREKRILARKNKKKLAPLVSGFLRYANVFSASGFPISLASVQKRIKLPVAKTTLELFGNADMIKIGLAPFARHMEKMYPIGEMEKVIAALCTKGFKLYFFGGGIREMNQLSQWEKKYPLSVNMAGRFSFEDELALISNLDLMISMDSANMHLASLYGVPVVSIWGATHPYAGFYGFAQNPENIVQTDLSCRPCSVFGNKKCYRGDWACMKLIRPEQIIDKTEWVLGSSIK